MVLCETSSACIGIKILLSDLISQINETNIELVKKMLYEGCIEDENNYYNEVFKNIVGYGCEESDLPEEYLECKEYLINKFKSNGSYSKNKFTNEVKPYFGDGYLYEKELLVPIKDLLSTDRWGYNRRGINSLSRPLDFNLSVSTEEYKEIKGFNIVFFIRQNTG
jgi:hypothetical protein